MGQAVMRNLLFTAFGLILLVAAVSALYGVARADVVAEGVRVAGVDVGGLSRDEARRELARRLESALARPVRVRVAKRRLTLSARRSRARADVSAMVDSALDRSGRGTPFGRAFRDLTGRSLDVNLPAQVSYDRQALRAFARDAERLVDRPARGARLRPSGESVGMVPARRGVEVAPRDLERAAARGLRRVGRRSVKAPARFSRPKVSTAELRKRYPRYIVIDREGFRLRFYRGLKLKRTYTIAVGQVGFDTPVGLYRIQNKGVDPTWQVPQEEWAGDKAGRTIPPGPENPIKARWMGIYDGAGIHGTDEVGSLGTRASHGCIRMAIPEVKQLYGEIPVKTPVYID